MAPAGYLDLFDAVLELLPAYPGLAYAVRTHARVVRGRLIIRFSDHQIDSAVRSPLHLGFTRLLLLCPPLFSTRARSTKPRDIRSTWPHSLPCGDNMASASAEQPRMRPLSPRIPALLQRQPSQQELEVARQLVEHSQSAYPQYDPQLPGDSSRTMQQTSEQLGAALQGRDNGMNGNMQQQQQPQPSPGPSAAGSTSSSRRSPATGLPPGGQMCRYAITSWKYA